MNESGLRFDACKDVIGVTDARQTGSRPGELESRLDLAGTLLTAPSDSEAMIAYSLLRHTVPDSDLVALANFRELIAIVPQAPFSPPLDLEVLGLSGYEATGRSMRRLFESDHGVFGVEFSGVEDVCHGIDVVTFTSRFALHQDADGPLDETMLEIIVNHELLFEAVAEGVSALGLGTVDRRYSDVEEFPRLHAAAAAGEAFGELF